MGLGRVEDQGTSGISHGHRMAKASAEDLAKAEGRAPSHRLAVAMTPWFSEVENLILAAARRCKAEVFTDLENESATLSCPEDSTRAPVSFSVGNDCELSISLGLAVHYEVYDRDPQVLIAEASDVLAAVLDGLIRETVWTRNEEPIAAEAVLLNSGRKIHWRKGLFKRGAAQHTLVYGPYECAGRPGTGNMA